MNAPVKPLRGLLTILTVALLLVTGCSGDKSTGTDDNLQRLTDRDSITAEEPAYDTAGWTFDSTGSIDTLSDSTGQQDTIIFIDTTSDSSWWMDTTIVIDTTDDTVDWPDTVIYIDTTDDSIWWPDTIIIIDTTADDSISWPDTSSWEPDTIFIPSDT